MIDDAVIVPNPPMLNIILNSTCLLLGEKSQKWRQCEYAKSGSPTHFQEVWRRTCLEFATIALIEARIHVYRRETLLGCEVSLMVEDTVVAAITSS